MLQNRHTTKWTLILLIKGRRNLLKSLCKMEGTIYVISEKVKMVHSVVNRGGRGVGEGIYHRWKEKKGGCWRRR